MKAKLMDYDQDWEDIKENELAFLLEPEAGTDPSNNAPDIRETVLRSVISMASFN